PLVAPCGDAEALTAAVPPPDDPEVARQVQQQRESLASARSLAVAGAHERAAERARGVLQQAESLGYPPLLAEAELGLGSVLREHNEHEPAHAMLSRAVTSALRSKHYEAAVEALAQRMWLEGDPLGQPERALSSYPIADAMLDGLGRPARLEWLLLNNHAVVQFRSGALVEASRSYRDALRVARSVGERALPVEVISTRYNLAMLQSEGLGRPDVAARELRTARGQAVELLGPDHPRVFWLTFLLAENLLAAGQATAALEVLEAARDHPPPDPYGRTRLRVELAGAYDRLRRHAAALEVASEALALTEGAMPDDPLASIARWRRGIARIGLGEVDAGVRDLLDAVARESRPEGSPSSHAAMAHLWAGLGLRRAGRLDEAIAQLERALELTEALGPAAHSAIGRRFFDLVDAYLERGEP
ncbi:MAG: tetratricopeptide repeat protein, partial [Myxococcales bacterium]|nr:tetratricopeptide repeat protein [Myxococcales bacterium]